ncbi:hypothetical protein [Microbulbifer sp.]|uniref:hypothetical protein n=1 Tax=Microbulbifer sp. TaxID=1908541 RepID=UPI003F35CA0F
MIVVILALVYTSGYYGVRSNGILVHHSAYFINGVGVVSTASHTVVKSDFVGSLQPKSAKVAAIANVVFAPLRWIEAGYWHYAYPKNEIWPYVPKSI